MSSSGDNWVVPGANPANQPGGVETVTAGTNISVTGTPINPVINSTAQTGVTQVEGQTGNVNLNGVGMTITGGSPVAGDVTFTAAVQSIASSNGTVVVTQPTPGNFNLAVIPNPTITGTSPIVVSNPSAGVFNVALPTTPAVFLTQNSQISGSGTGQVMAPGTNAWFVTLITTPQFFNNLAARTFFSASLTIPYSGTGVIPPNSLAWGFVWGTPGVTPPFPTSPTTNSGISFGGTRGIIGTVNQTTASLGTPNTQLYLSVQNTSAVQVTLEEIPVNVLFTFYN